MSMIRAKKYEAVIVPLLQGSKSLESKRRRKSVVMAGEYWWRKKKEFLRQWG